MRSSLDAMARRTQMESGAAAWPAAEAFMAVADGNEGPDEATKNPLSTTQSQERLWLDGSGTGAKTNPPEVGFRHFRLQRGWEPAPAGFSKRLNRHAARSFQRMASPWGGEFRSSIKIPVVNC